MVRVLSCFLLLFWLGLTTSASEDAVVITRSGPIRGKDIVTASGTVTAFLGIPYAEPPVGELRFQKPRPRQPWSDVLEATSFGNSCYSESLAVSTYQQVLDAEPVSKVSEDCLFLNIWVPHFQPSSPAPALIWIHGGAFFMGSGSEDFSVLATRENIIVASMNYRVGSMGFLALPPGAPGNAGLWDQHLALSWLKENIAAFGGDPSRLTLGGQSAGGASVGFHLLSPASQHLFAQATLQSGAVILPTTWVSLEEAKARARSLGQMVGCAEEEDGSMVSCLQRKDPGQLMQKLPNPEKRDMRDTTFVPITDGEFLPDDPVNLLEAKSFPLMPILTGFTTDEGSRFLALNSPLFSLSSESLISHKQLLESLHLLAPRASDRAIEAAASIYTEGKEGEEQYRDALIKAAGDHYFLCPVAEVANRMASAGSPVFAYVFAHYARSASDPDWIGVPHGAELPYLFGEIQSLKGNNFTDPEVEIGLSQRVMQYWGQFVRTGSPNGENGKEWRLHTGEDFFRIDIETAQPEEPSPTRFCEVWDFLDPIDSKTA